MAMSKPKDYYISVIILQENLFWLSTKFALFTYSELPWATTDMTSLQ